jgi:hypothetical protein
MNIKRRIMRCIALLLLVVTGPAVADDIRGHSWGDSPAKVKQTDKGNFLVQTGDSILFADTINGLPVEVFYQFRGGRLVSAGYFNTEPHANKNDFIQDYRKLNELLTEKHGKPKVDKVVWRNDLYKDNPSNYGQAVSVGHLTYRTEWNLGRTTIVSMLRGDSLEVNHQVTYEEVSSLAGQGQKQERLKNN